MKIVLPKRVLELASEEQLFAYLILLTFSSADAGSGVLVDDETLYYALTGSLSQTPKAKHRIREGLNALVDCSFVTVQPVSPKRYVYFPDKITDSDYFITFDFSYIQKIYERKATNKLSCIRYFCFLVGSFNNGVVVKKQRNFVGNMPVSYFCELMEEDRFAIYRYNKALEDMGIIYVVHNGTVKEDGERSTNVYGFAKYKEHINIYAKRQLDDDGRNLANASRSYTQKVNRFNKEGGTYEEAHRLGLTQGEDEALFE